MSNFEERLLVELRKMVAAEPAERRQRRPGRLVLAGGLAAVLAAAAIAGALVLSTGTQAAYAVTTNDDGTVTVEIDSLSDAAGLEAKLRDAGVSAVVEYLPVGKACKQPWFTPAGHDAIGPQQSSVGGSTGGTTRFTITKPPAGTTLVISTQTGAGGMQAVGIAYAQGEVPPCQVVDAPDGSGPLGGPPAGAIVHTTGQGSQSGEGVQTSRG